MPTRYSTNPEFAAALGMHPTMVSRMRNGHRSPSLPTFLKICEVLELKPRDIVLGVKACVQGGVAQAAWFARFVKSAKPAA